MQMIGEYTELGTNEPGIDFAVDAVVRYTMDRENIVIRQF